MTDPVTIWSQAMLRSAQHLADIARRARDGYTTDEARQDLVECATQAASSGSGILAWWIDLVLPDGAPAPRSFAHARTGGWITRPGRFETTIEVPRGNEDRTIVTRGFRAHGEGATILIPKSAVTITPMTVGAAGGTVTVVVPDLTPYPQAYVYEGDIETTTAAGVTQLLATVRVPWFRSDPVT